MISNLVRDWPAYILMAVMLWFFIYALIYSWKQGKKNKEQDKSQKEK